MVQIADAFQNTPLENGYKERWLRIGTLHGGAGWPRTDSEAYQTPVLFLKSAEHENTSTTFEMFRSSDNGPETALNASQMVGEHVKMAQELIVRAEAKVMADSELWRLFRTDLNYYSQSQTWISNAEMPIRFEPTRARLIPEPRKYCRGSRGCVVAVAVNMIPRTVLVDPETGAKRKVFNRLGTKTKMYLIEMFIRSMYKVLDEEPFQTRLGESYILVGEKRKFKPVGFLETCMNPGNGDIYFRRGLYNGKKHSKRPHSSRKGRR